MGLASALTTALTGLSAAETQIDVLGNNLANSQTVGFKASETIFATQFLQTQSLGSSPTLSNGGTNPRQTGLGVQVAEISPDFSQGTIEISSNPSDLAIQGNGFFVVESPTGEQLYTRNGIFRTNSLNQLVTVTGSRLLGFGVDELFQVQATELVPLQIPLGSTSVAKPTTSVNLEGALPPTGDPADTAEVIQSSVFGDASVPRPDIAGSSVTVAPTPSILTTSASHAEGGGGTHAEGSVFRYKFAFVDDSGTESLASAEFAVSIPAGNALADNSIQLSNLPTSTDYARLNIYRTAAGGSDYFLLDGVAAGTTTYTDDNSVPLSATPLNQDAINGNFSYLVTFHKTGEEESRPSLLLGPQSVVSGRLHLSNLPVPPPTDGSFPAYDKVRIYRNLATDSSSFFLLAEVDPGESYTDSRADAAISDLSISTNRPIDLDGPKADTNTLLADILLRDGLNYEPLFRDGSLSFTGRKGGRSLQTQEFQVTSTSTFQDLVEFLQDATGIQVAADDPQHPIPNSVNNLPGETLPLAPGVSVQNGRIRVVANNGVDNAVAIGISSFLLDTTTGLSAPNLGFGSIQQARGQSTSTDFVVYDSLGISLGVRVTAVLENVTGSATTYRWYADSASNDPTSGIDITVGTGLITFDGEGRFVQATNSTVSIDRRNVPSASPLEFDLDFRQISGLAASRATLAASSQDGAPPGTLTSFSIGEDGVVRGLFDNGISQNLGLIRMARFTNPTGLEQRGENLFAGGVNSGLPVSGNPGENGIGTIVAGAVELSNTDIGANLIDLVLATTQYRGNTRVITAAQQLLDELLNLRR